MEITAEALQVTGEALPAERFRMHESVRELDVERAVDVLEGRLAAYRVRGFVSAADCAAITANFWASPDRIARYGEGADGVEAYVLGASHIDRSAPDYLDAVDASRQSVADLYTGTDDPVTRLRESVAARLGGGRPAHYGNRRAGDSKAVCWNNDTGELLLLPHDDLAQLSDPLQHGFEIQRIERVMAVNIYPHVPGGTGQLKLWNVAPDAPTRERLGVTHSGYPYPMAQLAGHDALTIPVQTGDLCLINGNLVHAVLGGGTSAERARLVLTCFTGMVGPDFVWWT